MRHGILGLWVVALLLVFGLAARADEEKVELNKLPRAVAEAVRKTFPKARLVSASREVEDGKPLYEVRIKDGGQTVEVTATAEGAIVEIEKEITVRDLPRAVRSTLDEKYPGASLKKVEEIYKGKKLDDLAYEVLLVARNKKTYEVKLDPRGKVVETEEKKGEEKE